MNKEKKSIVVLGSTGSVGLSTLSVIEQNKDRFETFALTAHSRIDLLIEQCHRFEPKYLVVSDPNQLSNLKSKIETAGLDVIALAGQDGLNEIVQHDFVDFVVSGIVGAAGLGPIHKALLTGKTVLVANKEPIVMAGDFLARVARECEGVILPVDSEHNAIFQCLSPLLPPYYSEQGISKILLTASGGPFLQTSLTDLRNVTVSQAIKHPKWNMGRKISVDSATMMNKGLEVIEAHHLFAVPAEAIEVVIHPQSIVHSMVQYIDGSTLAQLANPDMRVPIAHCLNYPKRVKLNV
ncbi:MAG TPA: 1-deoxy-D-xylulose-5-phosphate reductoisomerase, partial [Cryomorphaceae bacterium]|nr:1-deoxy-D-xylulose-5-phosphate reductoisomerase [Cryomorphaceae bacterium]